VPGIVFPVPFGSEFTRAGKEFVFIVASLVPHITNVGDWIWDNLPEISGIESGIKIISGEARL